MNKELKNFPSEQLPNDGGWHWDRLIDEANARLKQIGKHGKRATIKKVKPGKPMSIQFSLPGEGQQNPGLNMSLTKNNLIEAEKICTLVTSQLVADTFTLDWFYSLVGKPKPVEQEKTLTCGEMLEQYKAHFFKQRKNAKTPNNVWNTCYRHIEKIFLKYKDSPISLKIVKETIECTPNNTTARKHHLNGLAALLKYFDNNNFKQVVKRYKSENNPKAKSKYIPTDSEIIHVYQTGFEPKRNCPKKYHYRYSQWKFLYALLAVYGLRVHEAWNIKNWDKAVRLKAGDWIALADDKEDISNKNEGGQYFYHQLKNDEIIPAILDPENKDYLLCIGHETKTGYRVAFPISPSGVGRNCNWIKMLNIVQPVNLPDIDNPLERKNSDKFKCTNATSNWFNPPCEYKKNKYKNGSNQETLRYGFTAHALRHAYNIRGHKLGVTQKMLADSLGHGIQMNSVDYVRHEQGASKIQGIKEEVLKHSIHQSELERLQEEIKFLKAENEKLQTELAMYKAIEQLKHKE